MPPWLQGEVRPSPFGQGRREGEVTISSFVIVVSGLPSPFLTFPPLERKQYKMPEGDWFCPSCTTLIQKEKEKEERKAAQKSKSKAVGEKKRKQKTLGFPAAPKKVRARLRYNEVQRQHFHP